MEELSGEGVVESMNWDNEEHGEEAELTEAQVQRIIEQEFRQDTDFSVATAAEETKEKTVIETVETTIEPLPPVSEETVVVPATQPVENLPAKDLPVETVEEAIERPVLPEEEKVVLFKENIDTVGDRIDDQSLLEVESELFKAGFEPDRSVI